MNLILKILLTAAAVLVIAHFLPGVSIENYTSAIIVAIVLGLLRITVKPILVILTLPVTILTLGLFLLVINALIIMLADSLIGGFYDNWCYGVFINTNYNGINGSISNIDWIRY